VNLLVGKGIGGSVVGVEKRNRQKGRIITMQNKQHPHSTLKYVEWMAKVWKANYDRNTK
jgi:transposase